MRVALHVPSYSDEPFFIFNIILDVSKLFVYN